MCLVIEIKNRSNITPVKSQGVPLVLPSYVYDIDVSATRMLRLLNCYVAFSDFRRRI